MNNDWLEQAVRNLPRESAKRGFTARVLAELHEPNARHVSMTWSFATGAAVAVGLLFLTIVGLWQHDASQEEQERLHIAQMRAEHEHIERELAGIRRQLQDGRVMVVGGDDHAEYVIELYGFYGTRGKTEPNKGRPGKGSLRSKVHAADSNFVPVAYAGGTL